MPDDLGERLGDRLKIIPGAGHMPHVERPKDVATLLSWQIGQY